MHQDSSRAAPTTQGFGAPYALVTGGAGFIGSNVADRLARQGHRVLLLDNLSRPSVERNVAWLRERHGERVRVEVGDVRDAELMRALVRGADQVFHFAAQVAVTTSLDDPMHDFLVNAAGTVTLLEALRALPKPPPLVFSSTNKVYGALPDVDVALQGRRWEPRRVDLRAEGLPETRPLDFHSPYGCSKGAADQYVVDYARTFGLPACVFRMSCIYGPRQFGNEDQGWVAHFLIRALDGEPITIYGDGRQVRDVLFVDDLVDAYLTARDHLQRPERSGAHLRGRAFNIGGGPTNTLSLMELVEHIERLHGRAPMLRFDAWRPGDQRWYVSDPRGFGQVTGWRPRTSVAEGLTRLYDWLADGHAARTAAPPVKATGTTDRPSAL